MVISSKIKCEICDSSFYIKYQMDQLIYQYPWNLDFIVLIVGIGYMLHSAKTD